MPKELLDPAQESLESVPLPIRLLSDRFKRLLDRAQKEDAASPLLRQPSVHTAETYIVESIQHRQRVADLATDSRTLLTCYSQHFRIGAPTATAVASAQGITAPGLRRRYNLDTVAALDHLLQGEPDPDALVSAFPSLELEDLFGIHPVLDTNLEIKGVPRRPSASATPRIALEELDDRTYAAARSRVDDRELQHAEQMRTYKQKASELLGIVIDRVRSDLFGEGGAAWMDGWTNPRQVRLEWLGGPSVSQVAQLLLPVSIPEEEETFGTIDVNYGIAGLRLKELSYEGAVFAWHTLPDSDSQDKENVIDLSITRIPAS